MKKSRKPCYYCGAPIGKTGSKEHAPPRMMFLPGTSNITVFACREHNQDKSYRDAVIVSSLLRAATKQWRGLRNIDAEVLEAMKFSQQTIEGIRKTNPDLPILDPLPIELTDLPDLTFVDPKMDIYMWMRQLTAALVYDAINRFDPTINWDKVGVISPHFVQTAPPFNSIDDLVPELTKWKEEEANLNTYHRWDGWASGPSPYPRNIYMFQISFLPDYVYFKHRFYDTFDWYVRSKASRKMARRLREKLDLTP